MTTGTEAPLLRQPLAERLGAAAAKARGVLRELWQDKAGFFGLLVVLLLVFVAIAAPLLAPHDPAVQDLRARLAPPFWQEGGSVTHLLGTDNLGRDVLSRMIFGARISLLVGVGVVLVAGTFGTLAGLFAGYFGGRTDTVIMRIIDTQVAFPGLLLALVILAVVGPSVPTVILVLCLNGWMVYGRVTRGVVLSAKEKPYVEIRVLFC
jgi:ABC-type dipeptide/oligopeptide/nickel transport system permease subunit